MSDMLIPVQHGIRWDGTNQVEIESKFELNVPDPGYDLSFSIDGTDLVAEFMSGGPQSVTFELGDWITFQPTIFQWSPGKVAAADIGVFHVRLGITS